MAMTLVSTVTVGSGGAAAIEFTNIPQTGKDLYLTISGRTGFAGRWSDDSLSFTSGAGISSNRALFGNESNTVVATTTNNGSVRNNGTSTTTNTFSSYAYTFINYTSNTPTYSFEGVIENNSSSDIFQIFGVEVISQSSPVTTIKLTKASSDFVQHTTLSLYIIS